MKFKNNRKMTSWIICMMLIVLMAFSAIGCSTNEQSENNQPSTEVQNLDAATEQVLGEGQTQFMFIVVDKDGNATDFEIHTDKETVGDALLEVELITGEESEYGLFVKTVNGITADYDVDQTYWAFYVNDEYALSGVDTTAIEDGKTYSFKVEK